MVTRCLAGILVLLPCLALAQEPRRRPIQELPKPTDLTELLTRLERLESRLASLLKDLEAMRKEQKARPAPVAVKTQVRIFTLRQADAAEIIKTLQELLQGDERGRVRIALHQSSNSVIVRAGEEDLEMIEAVVQRLDVLAAEARKTRP